MSSRCRRWPRAGWCRWAVDRAGRTAPSVRPPDHRRPEPAGEGAEAAGLVGVLLAVAGLLVQQGGEREVGPPHAHVPLVGVLRAEAVLGPLLLRLPTRDPRVLRVAGPGFPGLQGERERLA